MNGVYRKIGPDFKNESCDFCLWAPMAKKVQLIFSGPDNETIDMHLQDYGYWYVSVPLLKTGTRYSFKIDDSDPRPDPASIYQSNGIHESSEVFDITSFKWDEADWKNPPLSSYIIYELHVGTFSKGGSFKAVSEKIPYFKELGVNAIEIMPVSQFPGERNWGYDGVYPFAVQNSYGGPAGLLELVNECHRNGIAVILDVVYNHLGPEGNYLSHYGPYFSPKYHTPWGDAVNFDDAWSFGMRNYVINNMLLWFRDYHIDALRLDAIHAIYDFSAIHIMQELVEEKNRLSETTGKPYYLIAESDLNDSRYISDIQRGGYGMDAQWSDDLHHSLHALLTGEDFGYYLDFGTLENIKEVYKNAFYYKRKYSVYRKKIFGNNPKENPASQFIVCSQNHDQIGNRKNGERLSKLIDFEALKLVAGCVITSPYIPMLFMGEEYAEDNPFLYFVSHTDENLNRLVKEGRQKEFSNFFLSDPAPPPDPAKQETFESSRLSWDLGNKKKATMLNYYRELIRIRKSHPVLNKPDKENLSVSQQGKLLIVNRNSGNKKVLIYMNFADSTTLTDMKSPQEEIFYKLLDSAEENWNGSGSKVPTVVINEDRLEICRHSIVIFSNYKL